MTSVQLSFHTTKASLFEIELELNSIDSNLNEPEHSQEMEIVKHIRFL